jgi:UDP-N-acetylglucosamine pyrophosphorylase
MPNAPANTPTFESDIAKYWFEDGILMSDSKCVLRTVDNISNNALLVKKITNNTPALLLIYLADSPIPDKATRQLSTEVLPTIYKAMAMVSKPGLSQFIMKILFKLKQPPIPMKNFSNTEEAKAWLKQFKH